MFREPDAGIGSEGEPGFHLPRPLDFEQVGHAKGSKAYLEQVNAYASKARDCALELTALDGSLKWEPHSEKNGIKCDGLTIAGTQIQGIRHIAEFELSADAVLDAYNRLNYTDIIDKYTTHVECIESVPTEEFSWMQVVWTYDRIFPVGATRDFVTLDFIDRKNMMLVSKSVEHSGVPRTEKPGWGSIFSGSLKAPTYRVPLLYALRVVPCADNDKRCTVIQFQWSDIAGFVPEKYCYTGIVQFGFDNIPKFRARVQKAAEDGAIFGEVSGDEFLADPLKPHWRQLPKDVIPALETFEEETSGYGRAALFAAPVVAAAAWKWWPRARL